MTTTLKPGNQVTNPSNPERRGGPQDPYKNNPGGSPRRVFVPNPGGGYSEQPVIPGNETPGSIIAADNGGLIQAQQQAAANKALQEQKNAQETKQKLQTTQQVIEQLNESAQRSGSNNKYGIQEQQGNIYITKTTNEQNGRETPGNTNSKPSNLGTPNLRTQKPNQGPTHALQTQEPKPFFERQGDQAQTNRLRATPGSLQEAGFFIVGTGAYAAQTVEDILSHPYETVKGTVQGVAQAEQSSFIVGTTIEGVPIGLINPARFVDALFVQPLKENPEKTVGAILAGEVIGLGLREIPVSYTKVEIGTTEGTTTLRTIGFESGTRAQPLVTLVDGEVQFGTPKPRTITTVPDLSNPEAAITRSSAIPLNELSTNTPQPESALAGKVFNSQLDLTEAEKARITSAVKVSKALGKDTGQTVKDVFFNVEGLNNPGTASTTIELFIAEQQGIVYGSSTTAQLPPGFRTIKPGDIDTFFPSQTPEELRPKIQDLSNRLQSQGENVRVSASNAQIIEFSNGNKLLEAKTGKGITPDGEEIAPAGFLGIKFANLKEGQSPSTVPFGTEGARAIKAGEQLQRKGAASLIASPGIKGSELPFEQPGITGKPARALKDTAGFIQSGEGLLKIREGEGFLKRLFKGRSTNKAQAGLEEFKSTFNTQQLSAIDEQIRTTTGKENNPLPLSDSTATPTTKGNLFQTKVSPAIQFKQERSPSISPGIRTRPESSPTLRESPSPKTRYDNSPSISPSPISPSPSFSLSPSTRSPSPKTRSPSPRISPPPRSPTSGSPSPTIRPPPRSPKLGSPSPNPVSPSPRISPPPRSPSPRIIPPPFRINKGTTISLPNQKNTDFEQGFNVFVRRGGKFKQVETAPLARGAALRFGADVARNTAARSFKIERTTARASSRTGSTSLNDFYKSKKENGVFIQKNKYSISSAGELREITFKGIQANKRRRQ